MEDKRLDGGAGQTTVSCANCGAVFDAGLPKCPYCGRMNLPAAEREYMDHMEEIRGDLHELGAVPGQKTRKGMRRLAKRLLAGAAALVLLAAVFLGLHLRQQKREAEEAKADYLWQRETYARLDEAYKAGDYASLLAICREAEDAGRSLYNYPHYAFCDHLEHLDDAKEALREVQAGRGDALLLFMDEIELLRVGYDLRLTQEEKDALLPLCEPLTEDLAERFSLTDEERKRFMRELAQNGYVPFSEAEQFLKEKGLYE